MTGALETEQSSSLPILSGLSVLGQQAQHFRSQVASGFQQRFDGAARAFSDCFLQERYVKGFLDLNRRSNKVIKAPFSIACAGQHASGASPCMVNASNRQSGLSCLAAVLLL